MKFKEWLTNKHPLFLETPYSYKANHMEDEEIQRLGKALDDAMKNLGVAKQKGDSAVIQTIENLIDSLEKSYNQAVKNYKLK